jgi:hypothetical protein
MPLWRNLGRRAGLRSQCPQGRAGSTPVGGTHASLAQGESAGPSSRRSPVRDRYGARNSMEGWPSGRRHRPAKADRVQLARRGFESRSLCQPGSWAPPRQRCRTVCASAWTGTRAPRRRSSVGESAELITPRSAVRFRPATPAPTRPRSSVDRAPDYGSGLSQVRILSGALSGCSPAWPGRRVRGAEIAGSSPANPTGGACVVPQATAWRAPPSRIGDWRPVVGNRSRKPGWAVRPKGSTPSISAHAPVAQWPEQETLNLRVVGSSPTRRTSTPGPDGLGRRPSKLPRCGFDSHPGGHPPLAQLDSAAAS